MKKVEAGQPLGAIQPNPAQQVELTWGAWHGDQPLTIDFPASWRVEVLGDAIPPLTHDDLKERLRCSIASPPLTELAKNKKRASIVVDDLTRPTPVASILLLVIEALERGGMSRDAITVVIGGGLHGKASDEDILKKVGRAISSNLAVLAHDCAKDLVYLGKSRKGTPIYVNRFVMESDLKIGVGSILPHPMAGFSGGNKILVPGVCGTETIRYLHDYIHKDHIDYYDKTGRRAESIENEFRREVDAIAAKVGLHYIVNVLLNHEREIAALFAGDRQEAYRQGVRLASALYRVPQAQGADILVANTYPFDTSLRYMLRGFWPLSGGKPGASKVALGLGSRGLGDPNLNFTLSSLGSRFIRRLKYLRPARLHHEFRIGRNILRKKATRQKQDFLLLCPGISDQECVAAFPKSRCFHQWDELLAVLKQRHSAQPVKVAVYPYAPLQIPAREGDRE